MSSSYSKHFIFILFFLFGSAISATGPNFIIVYMDDMGYNDVGVNGAPHIDTPNLDRMASEGSRFTSFYSGSAVCSPSRAALMTGTYPQRISFTRVWWPRDNTGMNPNEVTIAELVKTRGYATACIGKWHLGHKERYLPTSQGFDYYYGIPFSNDMSFDPAAKISSTILLREGYTTASFNNLLSQTEAEVRPQTKNKVPLYRNEEVIEFPTDQATITKRYTDETIKFARENKDKPFFIYLAHTMPHTPLFVTDPFVNSNPKCANIGASKGCGLYADVIEEFDHNMGRLLDSLKAIGIDDNTLVIFTSDNGPWSQKPAEQKGSADPFRGAKFQNWEGGMRVPFIARWPAKIPAGAVQNNMAALIDLFPTLGKLSNPDMGLPRNKIIDGKDISAMLLNPNAQTPHTAFFYDRNQNIDAVRAGNWKLRDGKLYNLANDIHEDTDLTNSNSAKASELQALVTAHKQDIANTKRPLGAMNTQILKPGCTDNAALNFDNTAELDNGGCQYVLPIQKNHSTNKIPFHISNQSLVINHNSPFNFQLLNLKGNVIFQSGGDGIETNAFKLPPLSGIFFLQITDRNVTQVSKLILP